MREKLVSAVTLCSLTAALAVGCSTTAGGGLTIFPTGHFLLQSTQEVVRAAPRPANLPRELQKSPLPDYYIQPGDVLLVEPASFDSPLRFPSDQTVLPDGRIDLGKYGRILVAGLTLEQVEGMVQEQVGRLEDERDANVNVRLISPDSAVFYVLGEVNAPGSYPLVGRETVLDAILKAGGITDNASPCNILLSRPTLPHSCRIVLPICYRQIAQLGDTGTNYQIRPGDRVYIASRRLHEQLSPNSSRKACAACSGDAQCPCPDPSMMLEGPPYWELPLPPPAAEILADPTR